MADQELQILMKKYIKQWMERQLAGTKAGKDTQSFVCLEGDTLQMLLMILLMHKDESGRSAADVQTDDEDWKALMEDHEREMKEILDLLGN